MIAIENVPESFVLLDAPYFELGAGEAPASAFLCDLSLGLGLAEAWISLGPGARARLAIRVSEAPGAKGHQSSDIRVRLAEGARLELSLLSALPAGTRRESICSASIGEGASLEWSEACFDAGKGIYRLEARLAGRGASFV